MLVQAFPGGETGRLSGANSMSSPQPSPSGPQHSTVSPVMVGKDTAAGSAPRAGVVKQVTAGSTAPQAMGGKVETAHVRAA
jgi:hypothetical protein